MYIHISTSNICFNMQSCNSKNTSGANIWPLEGYRAGFGKIPVEILRKNPGIKGALHDNVPAL